ncbi:energy transducer TonB [Flavobacterium sp. ENC]|uniref:energy transducer TonB n=1 Tax=Flavobacterium sp. ENC TaxID=2897330 RepID=UPI001E38747A|nr:energy transducer TonB [Flavobacterium sp. ENC]MCD0468075.1 energy transducer TonB [Flavobacterium sp. ENC]
MKLFFHYYFRAVCFLFLAAKVFCQTPATENKITYLDAAWAETYSENYAYIRVVEDYYSDKKLYRVKDYYRSKTLQMIGNSSDRDTIIEEGQFIYYYENGNKQATVNYLNGKKTGKEFSWYENGNVKSEIEYFENSDKRIRFKINNYWNSQKEQKVTDGNGDYEYNDEGHFEQRGKVKNGLHDGIWKGKSSKQKYSFTEYYENGKLVSGASIDSLNVEHSYNVVTQFPSPKRGIESFYTYMEREMSTYIMDFDGLNGQKMLVSFIVDKDGSLTKPKIIKGVHPMLNDKVMKIITQARKWNPGFERGIPIRVFYSLPLVLGQSTP